LRLRVGHIDDEFVALGTTDMCEPDASVAGCAFDYGTAWFEESAFFGVENAVECCAIFNGAAGVLKLGFTKDLATSRFGEMF